MSQSESGAQSLSSSNTHADALSATFSTSYAGVMAFIAVVHEGSFARAGERLGIGRSAVSRNVQRLENQLHTRLFLRTTRSTQLTREGERFFENCSHGVGRIVEAMNELREMRDGPPNGMLRISSTVGFGRKIVAPLLGEFRRRYPDITVDLLLDDRHTDFASDRIDVAFRNGRIEDSSIIAKRIIPMQMALCASTDYARLHGLPETVEDLARHRCVNFRFANGRIFEWEFKVDGQLRKVLPDARLCFNDADLVLRAVQDGHGLAQMCGYQLWDLLARGELTIALPQYAPDDRGHYICYLSRKHLPTRIRVFIDFMSEGIRALNLNCLSAYDAQYPATWGRP
ncbi:MULTISPECIES: LysR family transcriptional regulator [unclassified Cupriavidus]|uniref:LysR family transcriptional regulator n=1 Tax=Cupriavidus sp. H19C3 TaxID=3241603 RepID=UPI003BF8BEAF